MMATAEPPISSGFLPLLESLEDGAAGQSEQTDAYLTIANRLSGDEGRQFLPAVEKHFPRLGKAILAHISSPTAELSQAALQALGFCLYHSHVVSGVPETFAAEILSALCSLAGKSADKNTCTRALWVISKQSFPPDVVGQKVSAILGTLEGVWGREDVQSVVMEHEALNVIIRMLEQAPAQMGDGVLRWAKLVIPLVVHSAAKVRLRAAAAMEMGMPLLLEKQMQVAGIIEPMMSSKLIPELQKLFMSKNEANVLKLWPLFVKLLGKLLHRGGPFINSLLHLEELGFRSSSPAIKKIAFIAWKSLIDNFALNPDILCSAKRMKLLMQPLASINVRTEVLLLTKVEVWWYLAVQLGPNLLPNFDQVSVPLLQCTIGSNSPLVPGTPSRAVGQNGPVPPGTPKSGFNSPANTSRMSLNSSVQIPSAFPSIQLLGLEMLLHYFLGPEVVATAAKKKLLLSLEPLNHPLLSGASSFAKHAAVLTANLRDGFINVGKDAPDSLLAVLWTSLVQFVNVTIESGSKKDRQGGEVLTLTLQALQSIVSSEALPADKVLILFEATAKGLPQRVLGSASYQVGKMDVLNGTPALFLILLLYNSSLLSAYIEDERFFQCLQTLVGCGLSGPTSPLAFGEAVLGAIARSAESVQNKEQLWRMWSAMVGPLTDTITQSNEVNQGDALEHNFGAMNSALLFPITRLLQGTPLQQAAQKSMLSSWSKLYKVFARCSALVVTAEENVCCEELCAKMAAAIDRDALMVPSTLNAVASVLQVMAECVDFSPFTPQFQQKLKSPHTPVNWTRKRNKVLGNLSTFQSLLVQCLEVYLQGPELSSDATGLALVSVLSALFGNLGLANTVKEAVTSLVRPLALFYEQAAAEPPRFSSQLLGKLEKLLCDVLGCLQSRSSLAFDDELLALLSPLLCVWFPHKNKQLRASVAHFWNATFGNSLSLTYPDEIRPILSQVKQKTPIILPGFGVVGVPDELSGPYSSECSQLETNLSGMPVSSVGKRDSLQKKAAEPKASKSVSTKLDFGSPKPPPRGVLEEEASIDFVFIPPETKERVLTEHQKEVKRTKRVDIPAMYNNLDASLDTSVFTQYTQSQDDSLDKLATEQADKETKEAPGKVSHEKAEKTENSEATQDFVSPEAVENVPESRQQEEIIPDSADVSMEDEAKMDDQAEDLDLQSTERTSPNISGSSDLVSGTPQKPNSRRQSFITLEKYAEGKPASPSSASTFTGTLIKTPSSKERSKASRTSSSRASRTSTGPNSQDSQSSHTGSVNSQSPVNNVLESPVRPKGSGIKREPVRLTERLPSDPTEDEDVIPDTQTVEGEEGTKVASSSEETKPSSQEEESESTLDDSQSPPGEPRRSGRSRVRPQLPGEDPEEREEKYTPSKRRRSGEEPKRDSPKSNSAQSRRNTRSMQAAEEECVGDRLRKRSQRDKRESSQTDSQRKAHKRIKLFSSSDDFLDKPEPRRRSQTDLQSDNESQSQGRQRRRSRAPLETMEDGGGDVKKMVLPDKEESSQTGKHEPVEKSDTLKKDSQKITPPPLTGATASPPPLTGATASPSPLTGATASPSLLTGATASPSPLTGATASPSPLTGATASPSLLTGVTASPSPLTGGKSQEFDIVELTEKDGDGQKKDSQIVTSSSQTRGRSQESELLEKTNKEERDSRVVSASPATEKSQDGTNATKRLVNTVKDELKANESTDDNLSQEDSQPVTPSSDSQSLRRSRRSKSSSEAPGSEDKSKNKDSLESRSSSDSQPEAGMGGRTRRSKVQEEQSKSSPNATSRGSQSADSPKGKSFRRRSSPALPAPSKESSESESSEVKESPRIPQKRGRKPKVSLPSPLTIEPKEGQINKGVVEDDSDASQKAVSQSVEDNSTTGLEDSQTSRDLQDRESLQVASNTEEQSNEEPQMEVDGVVEKTESKSLGESPREEQTQKDSDVERTSSQEGDTGNSPPAEVLEPVGVGSDRTLDEASCEAPSSSVDNTVAPPDETTEKLQVSESSEEKAGEELESVAHDDVVAKTQQRDSDPTRQEEPVVPVGETAEGGCGESFVPELDAQCGFVPPASNNEEESTTWHAEADAGDAAVTLLQESEGDGDESQIVERNVDEETPIADNSDDVVTNLAGALAAVSDTSLLTESTSQDICPGSPAKQKDLQALIEADVGESPSGGRTRGTWSPSASPSTSILKKGLKRPLEEEATSPLVKSRRVSFANPIQHQEMADDIDRRSPAIRTSSPRRSKGSGIPQPKYVTTPTKGLLILSPRNLHSPGYKSSKKCLISEMSQEPRPVSRDCIYPALIGCSAPVEAVLPQISSNMWCRGFGQLVRARNIKTVGDLSALTPSEIKTLPIRSPKISNVKKALRSYEQQRKGRGGDELKSFDEMMMTSEPEEAAAPQNQDEEDKTSGETLATELVDEPLPADEGPERDGSGNRTPGTPTGERDPEGRLRSELDALTGSMTPRELGSCSPQRLVQIHEQLGGLMRRVAVELQTRLCRPDARP
ncbi:telomere-associated protein RIF1 isoform X2 [Cyclopterus lumpus]|uniref:telomere-associated protein RIF1 isoform X2 n=1 Tax=Cyclopterus lumpus TaxID=8103 RepID=UPI0014864CBF|nr:telomere-associated protein RIF1 isoform X2 [Cyclopterus lumpus]